MAAKRPNVLFFFTDDQRYDTIRALGNREIHTPNLDKLAGRGTTFVNAYIMGGTSGAVCMPSRAMLHTGRTLFHIQDEGQGIAAEHVMMGEAFRRAGYETYGIGKWHNGRESYARSWTGGAEIFFGGMNDHWNVPAYDFDPTGKYDGELPYCPDAFHSNEVKHREADHIQAGRHSTDIFREAAVEFLKKRDGGKPFLLYVAFMAPHDPRTMPKRFMDMYDPAKIALPENFVPVHPFDTGHYGRDENLEATPRPAEAIKRHIAEYYAMITHLDDAVGKVLEALEETGEADNTIIVFAGDNGLAVGRHGLMGKQNNYDHSVHVPLIFAGPGVPEGERREALCYLIDIFPTLCGLTGVEKPETAEGMNLVPAMTEGAGTRDSLYFAFTNLHRAVRDDRYKLIEYVVAGQRHTQLFDLKNDIHETKDLSGDPEHGDDLRRLRDEMMRWREEIGDRREKEADFWRGLTW
ncbi:MAG: sulfatase-like hydrolase/transferase [Planctomycetes bacterium]|nr:sulfatase-like hydrolase/transferase [Planctomycetota bacterium]